ncbi:hypothetical protein EJD97_014309, partial [Solanum chilense]
MRFGAVTFFISSSFHDLTPNIIIGDIHLTLTIFIDDFFSYWFQVHTLLHNPKRSYVNVPKVGTSTLLSQSMLLGSVRDSASINRMGKHLSTFPLSPLLLLWLPFLVHFMPPPVTLFLASLSSTSSSGKRVNSGPIRYLI